MQVISSAKHHLTDSKSKKIYPNCFLKGKTCGKKEFEQQLQQQCHSNIWHCEKIYIFIPDICQPNPCKNNGSCERGSKGFTCNCTTTLGFEGSFCENGENILP